MLTALVLVACSFLASFQDAKPPGDAKPPSKEQIAATCDALTKALEKGASADGAVSALQAALEVVDARVIAVIDSKGLRHEDRAVRDAAVEVLGRMQHPDALKALHEALKRDKKELETAPPRYATFLRAIARHGQESSIPYLVEDVFVSSDKTLVTARILGLGHIRSPKSVDELIQMMRSSKKSWQGAQMPDFRLALAILTGEDKGTDRQLWINWYGDHKVKLEVAAVPPVLPAELQKRWTSYWGLDDQKEDQKKEDKAQDAGRERLAR